MQIVIKREKKRLQKENRQELKERIEKKRVAKIKDLVEIDCHLINDLRRSGRGYEAKEILENYYKDLKKTKMIELNNIKKIDRRIRKKFGVCGTDNCKNDVVKGKASCQRCLDYKKKYNNNYRVKHR